MKISEVIVELNKILKSNGDLPVMVVPSNRALKNAESAKLTLSPTSAYVVIK